MFRDRDPPPSYSGENPQSTFRPFLRDLELWQASTDIPVEKQGVKLVQGLKGPAKAAVDALPVSSIKGPNGYKEVLKALKDAFQPYVETALPRAMEQVFFGAPRHHKESLADYLVRASNAQALLKDEGVDLPSKASGYLLFRQANLDSELEARLTTWLAGDFSKDNVVANLRRLERVHQEGSKKVLLADFGDADGEEAGHFEEQEAFLYDGPEEDSGEDFVYLNDGDLAEVMDEDEVMEALATYQQVRQHLKDTRLGRKFRRPPPLEGKGSHKFGKQSGGKFAGNPAGKGKGKGQFSPEARRVHIEQLKLRTRCRSCGQAGHWSKECRNAPHGAASQTGTSSTSRSSTSFYWSADSPTRAGAATFFTFGEAREMRENKCSQALLQDSGFVGVTTADHQALVDTCAQEGLIGKPALLRLCDALRAQGLRCLWLDKVAAARGIGGSAKTVGVVELPLGLAGVSGVLEATVVAEDVPLLLPVSLLRSLGAVLDFPGEKLTLTAVPVDMAMQALPSGHPAVSVLDFGSGWKLPCQGVREEQQFRTTFPNGQPGIKPKHMCNPTTCALFGHARVARLAPGDNNAASSGRTASGKPQQAGTSKLASGLRQALLLAALGTLSYLGLAIHERGAFTFGAERQWHRGGRDSGSYREGSLLQGLSPGPQSREDGSYQGASAAESGDLRSRGEVPQRRGERPRQLNTLCPVPLQMEGVAEVGGQGHRKRAGGHDHTGGDDFQGEGKAQHQAAGQDRGQHGAEHGRVPQGDCRPAGEARAGGEPSGAADGQHHRPPRWRWRPRV